MKKLFAILTLSLLFSMHYGNLFANYSREDPDKKEEVNIKDKSNPTRTLLSLPEVYYCSSSSSITINFENSSDVYNVLIYDNAGECVFCDFFIANGITQTYRISSLGSGLHTIVIVNNYREFEGEFINLN